MKRPRSTSGFSAVGPRQAGQAGRTSGFRAVVVGVSAGGMAALGELFPMLPGTFPLIGVTVQHLHPTDCGYLAEHLGGICRLPVAEAEEKTPLLTGRIYIAPANYHLLIERDETACLSVDPKVNYARPSIDVLFDSAARVWGPRLIGIILTGANSDGAEGIRRIRERGGLTIAQDPATAESPVMPKAAIDAGGVDRVMTLAQIGAFLKGLE